MSIEKPNRFPAAGQLRAALEGIPDDTQVVVNTADLYGDPNLADEQVITSAGFTRTDWSDGKGLQPDHVFGLECSTDFDYDDLRRRRATAEAPEPEARP